MRCDKIENMKALYRKYRPTKLSEVVGQEQVTEPLSGALKAGKIGHAYLFIGPRGCGKTSVARIFAHEVNGFNYEIEDDYVDIIEIDGASNRGIDNIRELREKVAIAPSSGKYKVYIIDEVHMLTKEAFNALLKTLEEPPKHAIFIMATTDAYKVPVTITSRAQVFTFKLAEPAVMQAHLKAICEKEGIKISDAAISVVVKRGGGSFRDSLSLLDQISTLSSGEITEELVVKVLGLPQAEKVKELLEAYCVGELSSTAAKLKEILTSGIKAETLVEEMVSAIVAEPRAELMGLLAKLPEVKAPYAEAKLLVALSGIGDTSPAGGVGFSRQRLATVSKPTTMPSKSFQTTVQKNTETDAGQPEISPKDRKAVYENRDVAPVGDFNWDDFLERVAHLNDAIYSQLLKTAHEVVGDTIHIYPEKKVTRIILGKDANKKLLVDAAGGYKVTLHEADEKSVNTEKDALLSKISDIMGGEVKNDGGGNPF